MNKKELEKLKQEIPKMQRWSPLYHILKTELTNIGYWRNKPRGVAVLVKTKTVKSLKKEVWDLFSLYIRTRDCLKTTGSKEYGLCVTCGRQFPIKVLHAGHFVGGRHNGNLFNEKGCHAQCAQCNVFLHSNPLVYRRKIIEMYGEGYDEVLEKESQELKKYTVSELLSLRDELKEKLKEIS